jgi:hypothetical protein
MVSHPPGDEGINDRVLGTMEGSGRSIDAIMPMSERTKDRNQGTLRQKARSSSVPHSAKSKAALTVFGIPYHGQNSTRLQYAMYLFKRCFICEPMKRLGSIIKLQNGWAEYMMKAVGGMLKIVAKEMDGSC